MRVGMILPGDFPPDIRVEKEASTLIPQHEISLLCLRRGEQDKESVGDLRSAVAVADGAQAAAVGLCLKALVEPVEPYEPPLFSRLAVRDQSVHSGLRSRRASCA